MLEYNNIIDYINNDIINVRLINNSYIENDKIGGSNSFAIDNNYILIKFIDTIKEEEKEEKEEEKEEKLIKLFKSYNKDYILNKFEKKNILDNKTIENENDNIIYDLILIHLLNFCKIDKQINFIKNYKKDKDINIEEYQIFLKELLIIEFIKIKDKENIMEQIQEIINISDIKNAQLISNIDLINQIVSKLNLKKINFYSNYILTYQYYSDIYFKELIDINKKYIEELKFTYDEIIEYYKTNENFLSFSNLQDYYHIYDEKDYEQYNNIKDEILLNYPKLKQNIIILKEIVNNDYDNNLLYEYNKYLIDNNFIEKKNEYNFKYKLDFKKYINEMNANIYLYFNLNKISQLIDKIYKDYQNYIKLVKPFNFKLIFEEEKVCIIKCINAYINFYKEKNEKIDYIEYIYQILLKIYKNINKNIQLIELCKTDFDKYKDIIKQIEIIDIKDIMNEFFIDIKNITDQNDILYFDILYYKTLYIYRELNKKINLYDKIKLLIRYKNDFEQDLTKDETKKYEEYCRSKNLSQFYSNLDIEYNKLKAELSIDIKDNTIEKKWYKFSNNLTQEIFINKLKSDYSIFDNLYFILFNILYNISSFIINLYREKYKLKKDIKDYENEYTDMRKKIQTNFKITNIDELYNINNEQKNLEIIFTEINTKVKDNNKSWNFFTYFTINNKDNNKDNNNDNDEVIVDNKNIVQKYIFECNENEEEECKKIYTYYKIIEKNNSNEYSNIPIINKLFILLEYIGLIPNNITDIKDYFILLKNLKYIDIIIRYLNDEKSFLDEIFLSFSKKNSDDDIKKYLTKTYNNNKEILVDGITFLITNIPSIATVVLAPTGFTIPYLIAINGILHNPKIKEIIRNIVHGATVVIELLSIKYFFDEVFNKFYDDYINKLFIDKIKIVLECFIDKLELNYRIHRKMKNMIILFFILMIMVIYFYSNEFGGIIPHIKKVTSYLISITTFIIPFLIPWTNSIIEIFGYYFKFFKIFVSCLVQLIDYNMLYGIIGIGTIGAIGYKVIKSNFFTQKGGFNLLEYLLSFITTENIRNKIINIISSYRQKLYSAIDENIDKLNNDIYITENDIEDVYDKLTKTNDLMIDTYKKNYSFNQETGLIEYNNDKNDFNHIITSICHTEYYDIKEIYMITKKDNSIVFDINNLIIDNTNNNISFIQNKPIHISLIMAYILSKKINFISESNLDLNLNLNMNSIINTNNNTNYNNICTEIFGENYSKDICSRHFYSILGKSGISMMINFGQNNFGQNNFGQNNFGQNNFGQNNFGQNNFGQNNFGQNNFGQNNFGQNNFGQNNFGQNNFGQNNFGQNNFSQNNFSQNNFGQNNFSQNNLKKTLIKANPTIQYEILKNLDWKIKINNKKKIFVKVEEWLKQLPDKQQFLYSEYLNKNIHVKNLINDIVNNLNNTNILNKIIINKEPEKKEHKKPKKRINKIINNNNNFTTINNIDNPYFYSLNYYRNLLKK